MFITFLFIMSFNTPFYILDEQKMWKKNMQIINFQIDIELKIYFIKFHIAVRVNMKINKAAQ